MKKVKLLVNTAYQGPRKEGEVIDVPDDFASRWVKNGIAEYAPNTKEPVVDKAPENDLASLSAKELFAMCKDKGLDVEAKKSKEYYIEQLTQ